MTADAQPEPLTAGERRAVAVALDRWTPNVLRRFRPLLGLSHAEIDERERQLAEDERAAWPGE